MDGPASKNGAPVYLHDVVHVDSGACVWKGKGRSRRERAMAGGSTCTEEFLPHAKMGCRSVLPARGVWEDCALVTASFVVRAVCPLSLQSAESGGAITYRSDITLSRITIAEYEPGAFRGQRSVK